MVDRRINDKSYFAASQHRRRRNILIMIPIIVAVVALTVGLSIATGGGLLRAANNNSNNKPIIQHFHPTLTIMLDGKPMVVPGQIGIDTGLWKDHSLDQYGMQAMSDGMSGMAPLHTHDNSGTIHVESSVNRSYTLGEFLKIWGGLNLDGKIVKATVDGKPVSDYRNIVLRNGQQINLNIQ